MTADKDEILKMMHEILKNAKEPTCPAFLQDERLEDAFKTPICNENGYSEPLPAIWSYYGYGKYKDGVLYITSKSASIGSNLYSQYLEEEAIVWDSANERLLLYVPDPNHPKVAFKGGCWQFAKRLKPEYEGKITLRELYREFMESAQEK